MAELFTFQKLEDESDNKPSATVTNISSDAMTLIVANSASEVNIYQRLGPEEKFELSTKKYTEHSKDTEITALALQDAGVQAASGDSSGSVHVWCTDDPESKTSRKFKTGGVVSIAISRRYILASFYDKDKMVGCMALIQKGVNLHDEWYVVKRFEGLFSRCAVSEHGKPLVPHIMYYTKGKIVYEKEPSVDSTESSIYPQETPPWCMRRNTATAQLLVFGALTQRKLLLWAPQAPSTEENPMAFNLSSNEYLKINHTLAMSSVVSSAMFLVSIFDQHVHIIRARRVKDIHREQKTTEERVEVDKKQDGDEIAVNLDESKTIQERSVLDVMTEHVKDPSKPLNLKELSGERENEEVADLCPRTSENCKSQNDDPSSTINSNHEKNESPEAKTEESDVKNGQVLQKEETTTIVENTNSRTGNMLPEFETEIAEGSNEMEVKESDGRENKTQTSNILESSNPTNNNQLSEAILPSVTEPGSDKDLINEQHLSEIEDGSRVEDFKFEEFGQTEHVAVQVDSMETDRFWSLFAESE